MTDSNEIVSQAVEGMIDTLAKRQAKAWSEGNAAPKGAKNPYEEED